MQYVIEVCSLPEGEHVGWLNKDGDIVCRVLRVFLYNDDEV